MLGHNLSDSNRALISNELVVRLPVTLMEACAADAPVSAASEAWPEAKGRECH